MKQLTTYAENSPSGRTDKYSRYAWVMQSMFDEVLDELQDTDGDTIGGWFEQFGKIIQWCGSGDDTVLPPGVREYLASAYPNEMLAITAGKS
jgi:hypothetical protein